MTISLNTDPPLCGHTECHINWIHTDESHCTDQSKMAPSQKVTSKAGRGYATIGLYQPKSHENVGSVLRAAGNFNVAMVAVKGSRYQRACTDTTAQYRHLPLMHVEDLHQHVPFDCVPVAVELIDSAMDIRDYQHPERAFYVFGPEDGTLPQSALSWCRDTIMVPTNRCMNLSGTVHVVLYDRLLKER